MSMRITGLVSGLDTDSMVQELVSASSAKKDELVKAQTKLGWQQEAWESLNSKVYSFFNKYLNNLKYESAYTKKKTTIADSSIASIVASENAVNGTQTLAVKQLAKSGYLTGGKLSDDKSVKTTTTLAELASKAGKTMDASDEFSLRVTNGGEETVIELTGSSTIADVLSGLNSAGVTASFDETNQRIFISASGSGTENDFSIDAEDEFGLAALSSMGLLTADEDPDAGSRAAVRVYGQNAVILLNGAEFESDTNSFSINGLTITANSVSAVTGTDADGNAIYAETTINTTDDIDGIYDTIKEFFTEYNALIKEMDTLYNADSASGYEPLTDDEKDAMSETEIEKWEQKIKDSLLRRDSDLGTLINTFKTTMLGTYTINGKTYSLSSFGIGTLGYFASSENERGVYHIDGDEDDSSTSSETDKLKTAIANDPETVSKFFSSLITDLQSQVNTLMKHTDYRSVYNVYDDKLLQSQYDDYTDKIAEQEEKLQDLEDRYYDQFSSMETALSKLTSTQSYLSSLFG